ncbi:glycosidase [Candidatus Wolfebacteria bacterium]|nr:glycosidase [Candidatus Wolfebacteria bacterium]
MLKKNIKSSASVKNKPFKKNAVSAANAARTFKPNFKLTKKIELNKKATQQKLAKSEQNPIISPRMENDWESWQTFNPGVVFLDNKIHFIYRAIGSDGISRLGYAVSADGLTVDNRLSYPVYEHKVKDGKYIFYSYFSGGSFGGAEDPRLVRINNEDVLYMTYTACDNGLRVGLTSIKVSDFLNNKWNWQKPSLISPLDEVHKNWIIFPEKINGKYAIIHSIKPNIQIEYRDSLEFDETDCIKSSHSGLPRKKCWDKWIRGAGAPPIKTKHGWLLFYHAMDDDWSKYKVGAMLLDFKDPTKILRRAKEPVLEPEEFYENNGYKPGVVYVSGAIIKDSNLLVYYGGADSHICVAFVSLEEFLASLMKEVKPILKKKKLKIL